MKNHLIYFVLLLFTIPGSLCFAKTDQKEVKEDFKTASNAQPGKEYAQVNSEGRVRVQIAAPEAEKVQLDISAVKYDLVKDEKGVWTGESDPQNEGFHYYLLWIDCAAVPDPGSNSVICYSRQDIISPKMDLSEHNNLIWRATNKNYISN